MGHNSMNAIWKHSDQLERDVEDSVRDVRGCLKVIEFLINPLEAGPGIPFGFHTVGFTRVLLPEIYMSGVMVNGPMFRQIYPFLKSLYTFLNLNHCALQPSIEVCKVINEQLQLAGLTDLQARPIDPVRLMYGQAMLLRYWATAEGTMEEVQGIQIVHRTEDMLSFPMVSTENQMLIDYVPFGTPCPEPFKGL